MGKSAWKLIKFFYAQRVRGFDPPDAPHLDAQTLDRLRQELSVASLYLEYGAGGSTLLADSIGVRTISVESDRYYARTIRAALKGNAVSILTPDIGITGRWGWPLFKTPTTRRLKRWRRYVEIPFAGLEEFRTLSWSTGDSGSPARSKPPGKPIYAVARRRLSSTIMRRGRAIAQSSNGLAQAKWWDGPPFSGSARRRFPQSNAMTPREGQIQRLAAK